MSETYPGQMLPELQEKTTVDSNDLFYMVSSNASKKIKGSNLREQMKPSDYTGATSSTNGANGLVPQPTTSDVDRFLKGDGTWGDISYAVGEVSGSIATFSDGSPLPMRSLKAYIEPVQDLHGYDIPWVGGAGKNKLPLSNDYTDTKNNITITVKNGILYVNGTSNVSTTDFYFSMFTLEAGTYVLSTTKSGTATNLFLKIGNNYINEGQTFTLNEDSNCSAFLRCYEATYNNASAACMIRLASVTDATFAPYSNICPISGWDECKVTRTGKNLSKSQTNNSILCSVKKGVTYTVSFEGNVGANIKKNTNSGEVVIWGTQLPLTFTADEDFNIYLNAWSANISNIQVEVGNQATTYEPYNGNIYTIDLDGTRYGGTLDAVSGVLKVIYGIKVYSGNSNEGWYADGTQSGSTYRMKASDVPSNIKLPSSNADAMSAISNQFIATSADNIFLGNEGIGIPTNGSYLTLYSSFYNTNDVSLWKTHLASNPMQLVYELATPQTIQLTPTQVKSLLGQNNVWADTGDVDVHYVRDLTITIDDILSRLEALEG